MCLKSACRARPELLSGVSKRNRKSPKLSCCCPLVASIASGATSKMVLERKKLHGGRESGWWSCLLLQVIYHEERPQATLVIPLPPYVLPYPDPCSKKREFIWKYKVVFFPFSSLSSRVYAVLEREQTKRQERTDCKKWIPPLAAQTLGDLWSCLPLTCSRQKGMKGTSDSWGNHSLVLWRENDMEHVAAYEESHFCEGVMTAPGNKSRWHLSCDTGADETRLSCLL